MQSTSSQQYNSWEIFPHSATFSWAFVVDLNVGKHMSGHVRFICLLSDAQTAQTVSLRHVTHEERNLENAAAR